MAYFFGKNILYNSTISNFESKVFSVRNRQKKLKKKHFFLKTDLSFVEDFIQCIYPSVIDDK